ncbi:MAG: sialidase family protein [Bradymonadia bacterium]
MKQIERYLVLPDPALAEATVIAARRVNTHEVAQTGRHVSQPSTGDDLPRGDLRPGLGGEIEGDVAGTLVVTKSGPVERGRWGWVREGDDASADLQLRQSPHVVGRWPDLIDHNEATAPQGHHNHPKLLPLASGDVLLWCMSAVNPPVRQQGSVGGLPMISRLGASDQKWSPLAQMVGPGPSALTFDLAERIALDGVQFPDTEEIVCVLLNQDLNISPTDRRLFVYVSEDDGATWTERRRIFCEGNSPDVYLQSGVWSDTSPLCSVAMELLPSGHIVALVLTEQAVWSLVSADRGYSWTAHLIRTIEPQVFVSAGSAEGGFLSAGTAAVPGGTVSCTLLRNGLVFGTVTIRRNNSHETARIPLMSADGITWQTFVESGELLGSSTAGWGILNLAPVVRPDGYLHLYGSAHSASPAGGGATTIIDELVGRAAVTRDVHPELGSYQNAFTPMGPYVFNTRHTGGQAAPAYNAAANTIYYEGYLGLDAVEYRGQVLLVAQHVMERSDLVLESSSLVALRMDHWQPLHERLASLPQAGGRPYTRGTVYEMCWTCEALPDDMAWVEVTGASGSYTVTLEDVGSSSSGEGGLRLDSQGRAVSYQTTALQNSDDSLQGQLRVVFKPVSGGDESQDEIGLRFALAHQADDKEQIVSLRCEVNGATTTLYLVELVTSQTLGSVDLPSGQFLEVIIAMRDGEVSALARAHDLTLDPDFDAPFAEIYSGAIIQIPFFEGDVVWWGQIDTSGAESVWKSVHLHRPSATADFKMPIQRGVDWVDQDSDQVLATTGEALVRQDAGITNRMRSAQLGQEPAQWFLRGAEARWRGEALTRGAFNFKTEYTYGADQILREPTMQQWRSDTDANDVEIILDAGEGRGLRPTAFAVVGRNWPVMRIEMSDTNDWGTPAVSYIVGTPFSIGPGISTAHRSAALWSFGPHANWTITINGNRVTLRGPSGGPWRRDQFASGAHGPRFYLADENGNVVRIESNTDDTLYLEQSATWLGAADSWAIISDRFAVDLAHAFPDETSRYRYCRLTFAGCTQRTDGDLRLGRILLGQSFLLSPDVETGWRTGAESGVAKTTRQSGAMSRRVRRPQRRSWAFDRGIMLSAPPATSVMRSPEVQPALSSWQGHLDLLQGLEIDGHTLALIWDGNGMVGVDGQAGPLAAGPVPADPNTVALVEVANAGEISQAAHTLQERLLANGTDLVPTPLVTVRGLVLREVL